MRHFAVFALASALAIAGSIENPSVERVSPGVYRLEFESKDAGSIDLFADSNPDKIATTKAVGKITQSPATLHVTDPKGRLYFHLKPERGLVRTTATRSLNLEGAVNFRDLGGYRTADGRYTRWGRAYRSNNLASLTENDYELLASIRMKLVCDVRVDSERKQQPTQWKGATPEFLIAPIGDEAQIRNSSATFLRGSAAASQTSLVSETRGYEQMVTDFAGQYDKVFHRIAAGELPMVFHCSAGRDRTGTFAALLLTMLNVPRETVVDDYLLTGKYLLSPAGINKIASDLEKSMNLTSKLDPALVRERLAMKREVMDSTFTVIDEHYGSFDNFRRNTLHVTDAELARIRELLIEP